MLPAPPPEPPRISTLDNLAPRFKASLVNMVIPVMQDLGFDPVPLETLRTEERQQWLYGFGRIYDDDRGIVTNVPHAMAGWHFFGLAVDFVPRDGSLSEGFYPALESHAMAAGLTSGADWNRNGIHDEKFCDLPHVQWFVPGMYVSPSVAAQELYSKGGLAAVWNVLHAS